MKHFQYMAVNPPAPFCGAMVFSWCHWKTFNPRFFTNILLLPTRCHDINISYRMKKLDFYNKNVWNKFILQIFPTCSRFGESYKWKRIFTESTIRIFLSMLWYPVTPVTEDGVAIFRNSIGIPVLRWFRGWGGLRLIFGWNDLLLINNKH